MELRKNNRMVFLDIIRILCAFLIFGRHSITMFGCSYGSYANAIILNMTGPVMTCFFMVSGFSLYYSCAGEEAIDNLGWFYFKRIIAILPTYYLFAVIWLCFNLGEIKNWLILFPIEIFGIQSSYNSLFDVLHNGGTWFVSCILICYAVFPIIQSVMQKLSDRCRLLIVLVVYLLLVYSVFIVERFGISSNYSNPFFRVLEFLIGVGVSAFLFDNGKTRAWGSSIIKRTVLGIVLLTVLVALFAGFVAKATMVQVIFSYIPIPVICFVLFFSARLGLRERGAKVIRVLSGCSYHFYLMQIVLWDVSLVVLNAIGINENVIKIIVSFIICTLSAIVVCYLYDRPIRRFVLGKISKRKMERDYDQ